VKLQEDEMSKLVRSCVVAAASAGLLALTPTASGAEDCKDFAAVGSGLNEGIAAFMAKQGAVNVAENRGWTVQGEATVVSCKSEGIFGTECTATSRACKKPK
jgi:hypothetical protein